MLNSILFFPAEAAAAVNRSRMRAAVHRAGVGRLRRRPPRPVEQLPVVRHGHHAGPDADRRRRRQVRPDVRAHLARVRHHLLPQHHHRRLPCNR